MTTAARGGSLLDLPTLVLVLQMRWVSQSMLSDMWCVPFQAPALRSGGVVEVGEVWRVDAGGSGDGSCWWLAVHVEFPSFFFCSVFCVVSC